MGEIVRWALSPCCLVMPDAKISLVSAILQGPCTTACACSIHHPLTFHIQSKPGPGAVASVCVKGNCWHIMRTERQTMPRRKKGTKRQWNHFWGMAYSGIAHSSIALWSSCSHHRTNDLLGCSFCKASITGHLVCLSFIALQEVPGKLQNQSDKRRVPFYINVSC